MKLRLRGRKKIQGTVSISGAKNSAVAVIPAAILCDEKVRLRNIPDIEDVRKLLNILEYIGYKVSFTNNILDLEKPKKVEKILKYEEMKKLRGSYYFYGAFLSKYKKIRAYMPGGCVLGTRPINYHLEGFKQLKANYTINDDEIYLYTKRLKGATINLEYPSVGATINLIIASTKAKGTTIISNAAREPEIVDVSEFLNSMGANIKGAGTSTITITGVNKLHATDYTIISDRIEAGSFLILASCFLGNGLKVNNVNPEHLISLINILTDIGINITINEDCIIVQRTDNLKPITISTGPYPEFSTDLAQPLTVLLTSITGESAIKEKMFTNRFSHLEELKKMQASINLDEDTYYIMGATPLKKATIKAYDLRGSFACIIAALLGSGITTIENIDVLFRGYEKPLEKLKALGINYELED